MDKIFMGLDPGTRKVGYGIIAVAGSRLKHLRSGVLKVSESLPLEDRLVLIFQQLNMILDNTKPDAAAIEKVFFAKNAMTAIHLGHARGILLLAVRLRGIQISEYPPTQVKQAVTSYGRAEKNQVNKMVKLLLNIKQELAEDEADALALAICHSHFATRPVIPQEIRIAV